MSAQRLMLQYKANPKREFTLEELKTKCYSQYFIHWLIDHGWELPSDHPLILLRSESGWTPAHLHAMNGGSWPDDDPIWFVSGRHGQTVAHVAAMHGKVFPKGHSVLSVTDKFGVSVADEQVRYLNSKLATQAVY